MSERNPRAKRANQPDSETFSEKDVVRAVVVFANDATHTGPLRHVPGIRGLDVDGKTYVVTTGEDRELSTALRKDLAALGRGELPGPSAGRLRKDAERVTM